MAETNQALSEAGLTLKNESKICHMVEVLIEDLGYDELGKHVTKPLEGIKIAGYAGCQTNRPFGIEGESFENPRYLDRKSWKRSPASKFRKISYSLIHKL